MEPTKNDENTENVTAKLRALLSNQQLFLNTVSRKYNLKTVQIRIQSDSPQILGLIEFRLEYSPNLN